MTKEHPVFIEAGDKMPLQAEPSIVEQPPAEENLGAGDISSVEQAPSMDDDKPL